jgi:hypothetical protein
MNGCSRFARNFLVLQQTVTFVSILKRHEECKLSDTAKHCLLSREGNGIKGIVHVAANSFELAFFCVNVNHFLTPSGNYDRGHKS